MVRGVFFRATALLLLLSACGCFALNEPLSRAGSAMAEQDDAVHASVVHGLPAKGTAQVYTVVASGDDAHWAPLRISVFAEDLKSTAEHRCTKVGESKTTIQGREVTCALKHVVTEAKAKLLVETLLPEAVKLHTDRLNVKPLTGRLKVPFMYWRASCQGFTVPRDHSSVGVAEADLVLYVAAAPEGMFARSCDRATGSGGSIGRPISGVMNFEPERIVHTRYSVRIAAHEIAHVLGFDSRTMQNVYPRPLWADKLRNEDKVTTLMISEKTKAAAREHYGCKDLPGMELDDADDTLHWKRRNAKDELMSPYVGATGGAFYTALTLAAFADLGFYKPKMDMAEPMSWGRNAGCGFLQKKCMEMNRTEYPQMFCNAPVDALRCTSDRLALGDCGLHRYWECFDTVYRYFDTSTLGGRKDARTDYCPVITPTADTVCESGKTEQMPGSLLGPRSRCLNGESIVLKETHAGSPPVGDVCAEVSCAGGVVQVKYLDSDTWHKCNEKSWIDLSGSSVFQSGRILCPRYDEVCTDVEKLPKV